MTELIQLLVINSLVIIGFWRAAQPGMIFKFLEDYVPDGLKYPVYECPVCMASFHSFIPYWIVNDFTLQSVIIYPFYILALAGLNALVVNYFFPDE